MPWVGIGMHQAYRHDPGFAIRNLAHQIVHSSDIQRCQFATTGIHSPADREGTGAWGQLVGLDQIDAYWL